MSNELWTPQHTKFKLFLTIIGDGLNLATAAQCSWLAVYAATKICQEDIESTGDQTKGGKLAIYSGDPPGHQILSNGDTLATLKIDPNACSKKIQCPNEPNNTPT